MSRSIPAVLVRHWEVVKEKSASVAVWERKAAFMAGAVTSLVFSASLFFIPLASIEPDLVTVVIFGGSFAYGIYHWTRISRSCTRTIDAMLLGKELYPAVLQKVLPWLSRFVTALGRRLGWFLCGVGLGVFLASVMAAPFIGVFKGTLGWILTSIGRFFTWWETLHDRFNLNNFKIGLRLGPILAGITIIGGLVGFGIRRLVPDYRFYHELKDLKRRIEQEKNPELRHDLLVVKWQKWKDSEPQERKGFAILHCQNTQFSRKQANRLALDLYEQAPNRLAQLRDQQ